MPLADVGLIMPLADFGLNYAIGGLRQVNATPPKCRRRARPPGQEELGGAPVDAVAAERRARGRSKTVPRRAWDPLRSRAAASTGQTVFVVRKERLTQG